MVLNMKTGKLTKIAALDHVNILTNDVERCRSFYIDILGFEEGFRPSFNSSGIWLYLDARPVVHIIETEENVSQTTGSIDHIAFRAHNFDAFTKNLNEKGVDWSDREVPNMDLHQLFLYDPHGIKIEFNFEGQDRPWKTLERIQVNHV